VRVSQTAPCTGTLTSYLVDENTAYARVLAESTGSTVTSYDYGADLARMDLSGGTCYYYIYDGLGSTRQLVDASGTVQQGYNYDAYGQPAATNTASGTVHTNFLFNGQQYDPLTKLYYLRARYYNPFHGRFLSQDPSGSPSGLLAHVRDCGRRGAGPGRGDTGPLDAVRAYLYCSADPVNHCDPTGLAEFDIESITQAAGQMVNVGAAYTAGTVQAAAEGALLSGPAMLAMNEAEAQQLATRIAQHCWESHWAGTGYFGSEGELAERIVDILQDPNADTKFLTAGHLAYFYDNEAKGYDAYLIVDRTSPWGGTMYEPDPSVLGGKSALYYFLEELSAAEE
jgi:RHS repeat-associated protein